MSTAVDLENYIPLPKNELVEMLCTDKDMPAAARGPFAEFCRLVSAYYDAEFNRRLEKLKAAYLPFDPDTDTRSLYKLNTEERQQKENLLFSEVAALLEGANYKHLGLDDLEPVLRRASAWGLKVGVDFRAFERLAIFVRGSTSERRPLRQLRRAWRKVEVEVPIHRRMVMVLKLRSLRRLGRWAVTDGIYLQLFKDIPRLDVSMLFPGARARMSTLDRARIVLPILAGLALTLWQIAHDVLGDVAESIGKFLLFRPAALIWAVAAATIGYGLRTYYIYQQTRQRYNLALAQVLYYQNLDTNLGVLYRLCDEAKEQDCREAILAYYFLLRHGGDQGLTSAHLEVQVEQDLERRANLRIDFEDECLARLEKLGIVEKVADRFRSRPLEQAIAALEARMNGQPHYSPHSNP